MVVSKTGLFSAVLQDRANLFKALAHPARLQILQFLAETKTCISGDISDYLPLSRTTVSQHLKELRDSGLIQGEIDGLKINYCLNNSNIKKDLKKFDKFFSTIKTVKIPCNVKSKKTQSKK